MLIDVQSYTDDAFFHCVSAELVFNEYATQFAVLPIDVVGPFNGEQIGEWR